MKKNLFNLKIMVVTFGIFFSTNASAVFTAVTSGNWSNSLTWGGTVPPNTVTNDDIVIPPGITVTLDADVVFSGLLNTFMVDGTLTNTTTNNLTFANGALTGTGSISICKITFSGFSASAFTGNLSLKQLVNSTGSLAFTAIANISDTLDLDNGTLFLNNNANLTMLSNSTLKVKNGLLSLGAGVFNSTNAYNVMYIGSSKTSGIELNTLTLQHMYLNMNPNQVVTLNNNTTINGDLNMAAGKLFLNGQKLITKGNLLFASGTSITSNALSELTIEGSGATTNALMFDGGSTIKNLTINRTTAGTVKIASALIVTNYLNLKEGSLSLENGALLTMNPSSTVHVEKGNLLLNTGSFIGTAAYNVEYMGNTNAPGGVELSGSGLNNVTVNYLTSTNKVVMSVNATVAGKLDMMSGMLDMNGKKLILNGTLSQNANASFIGNTVSELELNLSSTNNTSLFFDASSSMNQTLGKLKINSTGASAIVMGSKLIISNELAFVNGKIELANSNLEILSTAMITGFDDTKYIVTSTNGSGVLTMNVMAGSSYVTFPVGLSSNYSPAYIQQMAAAASGNFSVKCATLVSGNSLKAVDRIWLVETGVTTVNANLKFGWVTSAEVNGFDRTNAYVSHFTNSMWDGVAATSATAGLNGTFELSRTGLTSLSPFAVIENGQPLMVTGISINDGILMYPNPAKSTLTIKVAGLNGDRKYELMDITGRVISTRSNNTDLNKFEITDLNSGFYFIRITNLTDDKTTIKRFIKE